jgi:hypothetical protein
MTRLPAVRPYLTTEAVETGPWEVYVAGEARDADLPIDGWDYLTELQVRSVVDVDIDQVWADCDLPYDTGVSLVALWHSRAANNRGVGSKEPVWDTSRVLLSSSIPSSEVAERLTLTRQLVLDEDISPDNPLAPSRAGSILWIEPPEERTTLLLEGDAARFPTQLASFVGTVHEGAAWLLDLAVDRLDDSPMSALLLWVNESHPAIETMRQTAGHPMGRTIESVMQWDVARQMITAALANEEFRDRWGHFDPDSLGGTLQLLIQRALPGEEPDALHALASSRPRLFEARLQSALDLMVLE